MVLNIFVLTPKGLGKRKLLFAVLGSLDEEVKSNTLSNFFIKCSLQVGFKSKTSSFKLGFFYKKKK